MVAALFVAHEVGSQSTVLHRELNVATEQLCMVAPFAA